MKQSWPNLSDSHLLSTTPNYPKEKFFVSGSQAFPVFPSVKRSI